MTLFSYASQDAVERHQTSENYKQFFGTITQEELLVGPPQLHTGKYISAFRR